MTYAQVIQADHPVHWWRCNDPSGFLLHDYGSTPVHLAQSVSSFPYNGYSGIASDGGSVAEFSAVQFWMPDPQTYSVPFSFELWWWAHNFRNGGLQDLFSWGLGLNPGFDFRISATGVPTVFVNAASMVGGVTTKQHWHYVAATVSGGGSLSMYVDGVPLPGSSAPGVAVPTQPIHVGETGGNLGASLVTEIGWYNVALSAAQVNAHWLAQEVTSAPLYHVPGTTSGSGFTGSSDQLAAILAAVQKTFPTT